MNKIIACLLFCLATNLCVAKSYIVRSDFSYKKKGVNNYSFYISTYFNMSWSAGPQIKWLLEEKSNDTAFIKLLFDVRGHWIMHPCVVPDTIDYTNIFSDVKFINISLNTIDYYIDPSTGYSDETKTDTSWNEIDTTFSLMPTHIAETSGNPNALQVFPNPAFDIINIRSDEQINKLIVYSLLGEEVLRVSCNDIRELNIGQLATGNYTVVSFNELNRIVQKACFNKR